MQCVAVFGIVNKKIGGGRERVPANEKISLVKKCFQQESYRHLWHLGLRSLLAVKTIWIMDLGSGVSGIFWKVGNDIKCAVNMADFCKNAENSALGAD